jgi:hypothetical protein
VRASNGRQHVYIQIAATLGASKAPALLVQSRGGDSALVNHRGRLPYDIVDRLLDSVDRQEYRVTIRRKAAAQ